MSDALDLLEEKIERARAKNDADKLQRLYLKREQIQAKEFAASLKRRAKLNRGKP